MAASKGEASEVPKEETSEVAKEKETSGVAIEKEASDEVPPKAKKAKKKKKVFADIWVVKASRQNRSKNDEEETLIGAYSSKEVAIENARKTMENYEGEYMWEDNSETIGEGRGVVFSCYLDSTYLSMSIEKVSLDKPSSFHF